MSASSQPVSRRTTVGWVFLGVVTVIMMLMMHASQQPETPPTDMSRRIPGYTLALVTFVAGLALILLGFLLCFWQIRAINDSRSTSDVTVTFSSEGVRTRAELMETVCHWPGFSCWVESANLLAFQFKRVPELPGLLVPKRAFESEQLDQLRALCDEHLGSKRTRELHAG